MYKSVVDFVKRLLASRSSSQSASRTYLFASRCFGAFLYYLVLAENTPLKSKIENMIRGEEEIVVGSTAGMTLLFFTWSV